MEPLKRLTNFSGPQGPVVLAILDGVGIGATEEGDLVRDAYTPTLDWLGENAIASRLKAHGTAVGMPSDKDMGNSEVGHNAIGCGRVYDQGAALVNQAIASRALFEDAPWKELVQNVLAHESTLHFLGLFSDGNVHSHVRHLQALLEEARRIGIPRARVHVLLDGRDVPVTSALDYVDAFEAFLRELNADGRFDYAIASGGGRMNITMDRYNNDWDMVRRGWEAHVRGVGRRFPSARAAIETFRSEKSGLQDQHLPAFVIERDGEPVGRIRDRDSVVFFNFRGDRAIEITRAFEEEDFTVFDRGDRPEVVYAGMMLYDGDLQLPKRFLVPPPPIDRTLSEHLSATGLRQFAIAEAQKYGHVTYFFNGNRSGKFNPELEDWHNIPSDPPFDERPWMKAAEVTDRLVAEILSGKYPHIRVNYANGDMVGHTGNFAAVRIAVETVDLCLRRVVEAVREARGILIVSADHGNADDMYARNEKTGAIQYDESTGAPQPKTAHSLNPVPVFIYDPTGVAKARLSAHENLGIASLAATALTLMGFRPPEDYLPSVVDVG